MGHNFLTYTRRGVLVEVIVRDESNRKLDTMRSDGRNFYKVARILYKKYGVRFKPEVEAIVPIHKEQPKEEQVKEPVVEPKKENLITEQPEEYDWLGKTEW